MKNGEFMPFEFVKTVIPDVILIKPKVFEDERGFFVEGYKKSDFVSNGIDVEFNQDNHSKSTKGVLRGLHYQKYPKAQAKLVRCINGEIFDVAVDIRKNSPTFGKWVGFKLSAENKFMLYIPEGFAHGFVVLSDTAELLYKASNEFSVCEIVTGATFINPSRFELWKQSISRIKLANPQVTKQAILSMPTSVDAFNPTIQRAQLPNIGDLKDELNFIYGQYVQQFEEALEDPTTRRNRDLLNAEERKLIEQFEAKEISLNRQYARPLMEAINKLQRNFSKIEITHEDILRIFSRPMTKQQAIDVLTAYIEEKSRGYRQEDIRIIMK
jgi:dTDP-4-dehydrorhamnose 3,5-epimerase